MPTAAKLVSAVLFFLVGYGAAQVIEIQAMQGRFVPYIQPEQLFGLFSILAAAVGAACGWFVAGAGVGHGMRSAFGTGVQASATLTFILLLAVAIREMILRAMNMLYAGPFDAVQAVFGLFARYAHVLISPLVLAVLVGGGGVAGMLAEASARRWR
ncbi:tellurium resistance protein [Defluviimonas sp. 20V17]|uniref:Tellurium resistance protein n=1 Tax=Allgaiera indica TaxID=765699 RepID=A0AAN4ZZ86_9RHOB|nr:TrgA family protein [Allgaiera indica]KDB03060.1 tellurium resistance protein [Defluviimonas sp. 20V17]GHE00779.1 tellurium resistance protein [Allgaiera indica]SDW70511.1 hypothetical protein SAMN05444006_10640 [Allgaiera indica]